MRSLLPLIMMVLLTAGQAMAAEYYCSPKGDDASAGNKVAPWKTLGKACAVAGAGDTVYLRAGTYRETLKPARAGEAGKPIRFIAAPGEKAVLSGAEPLTGAWEQHQGNVYKLQTKLKFIQLFVDGKMMLEARWPNSPLDDLMAMKRAAAGEGTGYELIADPNLPAGDWNGAVAIFWPGSEWVNMTRRVSDYQPGKSFRFDTTTEQQKKDQYHKEDPYKPRAGNPYLLVGALAGLDSPGEWFLDHATGTVYLWTPDGKSPAAHVVEAKQRDHAVDLSKLSNVQIRGFDILGAAVNMTDAQSCLLEDCRLRYVEHAQEYVGGKMPPARNVVTGKGNTWRRCLIAYGATTAIALSGEDNALENCVIHDANYLGSGRGGLDLSRSVGARVQHCTIFRAGRDTIQHGGSKRIRLEYNDLYDGNMLNNDAGAIYCWGTKGEGGVIAYNWIHDNPKCNGIYLDNFSSDFICHHNLIWACGGNAFHINSDALNHQIYNNTVTQCNNAFGTYCYPAYVPTMKGMRVINNLINEAIDPRSPTQFVQGELGPKLSHNAPAAVDKDGYPTAGSGAIDAGIILEKITDNYRGKAPDLGAYEFGGEKWTAGADWKDPEAPAYPNRDLSYAPHPPITEKTMIMDGLALWLDAADKATVDVAADGTVTAWRDKSPAKRVALPALPSGAVKWVANGMNGKPVLRGNGTGSLRVADLKGAPGPVMAFVVSQAPEAIGPSWQRIIASYTGAGQEWVAPNWIINVPGGEKPSMWPPRIFTYQKRDGAALGRITVLGASAVQGQALGGDVAEVLVFAKSLRFDEAEAVTKYLTQKWGITE
ncbi:MAG: right-handed parallel beta-helix repeat-containing protein [Armatimonadota bacterium]